MTVIQFPMERRLTEEEALVLKISDEMDAFILKHLADSSVSIKVLSGVIAHRLGTLISRVDKRDILWDMCLNIAKDRLES